MKGHPPRTKKGVITASRSAECSAVQRSSSSAKRSRGGSNTTSGSFRARRASAWSPNALSNPSATSELGIGSLRLGGSACEQGQRLQDSRSAGMQKARWTGAYRMLGPRSRTLGAHVGKKRDSRRMIATAGGGGSTAAATRITGASSTRPPILPARPGRLLRESTIVPPSDSPSRKHLLPAQRRGSQHMTRDTSGIMHRAWRRVADTALVCYI